MTDTNNKKQLKSKKTHPRFKRPNQGRTSRSRIKDNWRKPRGQDNKQREGRQYMGKRPKIGYKNKKEIRGMHPCGLFEKLVITKEDIDIAKENNNAIRFSSSLGKRKKIKLYDYAVSLNLKVLNYNEKSKEKDLLKKSKEKDLLKKSEDSKKK